MKFKVAILLASLVGLAGCGYSGHNSFDVERARLVNHPGYLQLRISKCQRSIASATRESMLEAAARLRMTRHTFRKTYCSRLLNGIRSGRITHADMQKSTLSQNVVHVLQGKKDSRLPFD